MYKNQPDIQTSANCIIAKSRKHNPDLHIFACAKTHFNINLTTEFTLGNKETELLCVTL